MFIGTPMGRNHFYDLYKYAEIDDDPTYKAWHFTSYDNPLLDPEEINIAKKSMSSYAFRQEFMASFEALGSEIFKEDWIKFVEEEPEDGDYYIAVDLAGFADVAPPGQRYLLACRLHPCAHDSQPHHDGLAPVRREGLRSTTPA